MTIEQLNKIVSLTDLEKIQSAMEKEGYRNASKCGKWEFNTIAIANANDVGNGERYEDVFADRTYVGDIHTNVNEYPDTEFIVITVNKVYRDKGIEVPCEMVLFTNAPINEEYEKEQAVICRCADCKRDFAKAQLTEINGRLICDDCFDRDLERLLSSGKSKYAQKVDIPENK